VSSTTERGSSAPAARRPLVPGADGRAEARLAVRALRSLALLAIPVVAAAAALQGLPGALGAAAGLALVGVLFGGGGLVQALAVRRGVEQMGAVMLGGLGARLLAYVVALMALEGIAALHRPSLALATAVGLVWATIYEMRLISRTPELFWVQAVPGRRGSAPQAAGR
jgi:hypothetical protein